MRGTITQGDLSSWIASGSYRRRPDATHAYEAGLSYSAQRYLGGNTEALQAMSDASRFVGAMYAYDNWSVLPRVRVGYGAQYARYDYLERPEPAQSARERDGPADGARSAEGARRGVASGDRSRRRGVHAPV